MSIETVGELDGYDSTIIMRFLPAKVLRELKKIAADITVDGGMTTSAAIDSMELYQHELEKVEI